MTSKTKILSGHELVAKGFTKIEATLPEVGLKDVEPNGSWLEQKQIQSALEARKHLIEVERIEKSGALSVAVWYEEKMLAEVTQKVGGHWQFLGHNVGNQLYLYPEEALYLMEVNCLQLLHNDMKVSLQQAYSLLLRGKVTLLHYKVYASLSRLGYRLFRHEKVKLTEYERKIKLLANCTDNIAMVNCGDEKCNEVNESECADVDLPDNTVADTSDINDIEMVSISSAEIKKHKGADIYQRYVEKLKKKRIKPCNNEVIQKCFDELPILLNAETVSINVPEKKYIPKNIDMVKTNYNINIENIQKKVVSPASSDSNLYSQNDEVNGSHIRRIRHLSTGHPPHIMHASGIAFPAQNIPIRFFNYWRPSPFNFNFIFQRPFVPRQFGQYMPRLSTNFRLLFNQTQSYFGNTYMNNFSMRQFNTNISRPRRRRGNAQNDHLEEIQKLATRLKRFFATGNANPENVDALQRLINTYNVRYKTRIRLNSEFEIDTEQDIVETITLDDDEPQRKRHKSYDVDENFEQSLNLIKALAHEFKDIESKGNSTPKHRRAFTKALKFFNDTYNVEYYANNEFEIIDSRYITVASSDSDSHIEEIKPKSKSKKLKNPFNIMKRLSETQNEIAECSHTSNNVTERDKEYSERLLDLFPNNWLPNKDDFGRAEIVERDENYCLIDDKHDEFLYDFLTLRQNKFNNWLDLKISFFKSLGKAVSEFQSVKESHDVSLTKDGADIKNVIDKLKIIKTTNTVNIETSLTVDFDVYNRNVQNFKKSKPPPPHFRLICLNEQDGVPNGEEIVSLNAEYDDNITIVFAIVGIGSISYIRMNPSDLPMYIPSNKI
ncbi:uncharacterized protein LOC121732269 [Aricia agestis]|uniref:uncharacterized protein LOC121732269 n=1 Tax=Aricia agestis TaxID=91739 RepID=UPI001C2015C2|nr:uncharacterized protein LOC121732269 [Aricia agestis]